MLRKNIRLRREYLYNKQNEKTTNDKIQKKIKVATALQTGGRLQTELFKEKDALEKELKLDDNNTLVARSHIDDEYATAKYREPLLLITTSKHPSPRLMQFQKELNLVFPSAIRMNRGGYVIPELIEMSLKREVSDLVIVHEHRGVPDGLIISHLPVGPTIYFGLFDVVLRHDLKDKAENVSEASPHLVFDGFESSLGLRVTEILKHLFPVPKTDSKRVLAFRNSKDTISFRNFTHSKTDYKTVELNEVGPRFEMKPYQIVLGLLNQPEANKEWVIRHYINTAGKKSYL